MLCFVTQDLSRRMIITNHLHRYQLPDNVGTTHLILLLKNHTYTKKKKITALSGTTFDEIIVESNLNVRKKTAKPAARRRAN